MKISTIHKLCCPFDKGAIALTIFIQDLQENVLEGYLDCKQCNRVYPIIKGIPIMNPDEYREITLEQPLLEKWKAHFNGKEIVNFRLSDASLEQRN